MAKEDPLSALESPAPSHLGAQKPPDAREFTLRAVIVGMVVAAVIAGSYPYVVMKLGFGPNISVVSAFFGFLALGIVSRSFNRWENNIVQTAGTSAGMTAFLCVLMAAFDMLRQDETLGFTMQLTPWQSFAWLTSAGLLGVLLAVPMRRHFVVDEQLAYPDGIATAETLVVLDSRHEKSAKAGKVGCSMGGATLLSAFLMTVREDARVLADVWYRIPEMLKIGPTAETMGFGVSWSLLSLGSGMLVGMRINASMLLGTIASWLVLPGLLLSHGAVAELTRKNVLLWVMWPATGMLIAGGLTVLGLKWRILVRTFRHLTSAHIDLADFPIRHVVLGAIPCLIVLVWFQHASFGMPVWMSLTAVLFSIPLMLVGLRVLGETNWGPISALSNMMQAIFGVLAPGSVSMNMVASGVTGNVATQSEGLMQDYKTGHLIGSTPRYLTYAQLMAVPIGAAVISLVYPLLRDTYGIGGEHGLASPISAKWAGFAKLLSQGFSALPPGAAEALGVGTALGILFTLLEGTRFKKWTPSPTGVGIGMLVPASAITTMFLGGVVEWLWRKTGQRSAKDYLIPVASGFVAGEAIVAIILPILVTVGLLTLVN